MEIDYKQLEFIDQKLRDILSWLESETGFSFTITSIYRIDDPGVHGQLPVRGVDLRCRNEYVGGEIETMINDKFRYDPERPDKKCCICHGKGLNLHLHIQAHNNTTIVQ